MNCFTCFFILIFAFAVVTMSLAIRTYQEVKKQISQDMDSLNGMTDLKMSMYEPDPIKRYNVFSIPDDAITISKGMYNLGKKIHNKYGEVETVAFVTEGSKKRRGMSHIEQRSYIDPIPFSFPFSENDTEKISSKPKCCSYIHKFAKWDIPQTLNLDPTNSLGLNSRFIYERINNSLTDWNFVIKEQFSNTSFFRNLTYGEVSSIDINNPNEINDISFVYMDNEKISAVTVLYYLISSEASTKGEITFIEGDIFYNINKEIGDGNYDNSKFDLYTLSLHELGHFIGLNIVQVSSECEDSVMFSILSPGELRRSITYDDALCANLLYSDNNIRELFLFSNGIRLNIHDCLIFFLLVVVVFWKG